MKDLIGNTITEKSLLCWHPNPERITRGIICQAVSVTDGGLSIGASRETTPAMLVIQIVIPIDRTPPVVSEEVALGEFMCVVNPSAEAVIEKMMAGQRKQ